MKLNDFQVMFPFVPLFIKCSLVELVTAFPLPFLLKHNRAIDSLPVPVYPWKYMFPWQNGSQRDTKPPSLPRDDTGNVFQPRSRRSVSRLVAQPVFPTERGMPRAARLCFPLLPDPSHRAPRGVFHGSFRGCRLS